MDKYKHIIVIWMNELNTTYKFWSCATDISGRGACTVQVYSLQLETKNKLPKIKEFRWYNKSESFPDDTVVLSFFQASQLVFVCSRHFGYSLFLSGCLLDLCFFYPVAKFVFDAFRWLSFSTCFLCSLACLRLNLCHHFCLNTLQERGSKNLISFRDLLKVF